MATLLVRRLLTNVVAGRSLATATKRPPKVLVTGALGQLGIGLVKLMRNMYGVENVVASDIRKPDESLGEGPFLYADVLSYPQLESIVVNHRIDWIVHFSALLSATGELNVKKALDININGFQNVVEIGNASLVYLFIHLPYVCCCSAYFVACQLGAMGAAYSVQARSGLLAQQHRKRTRLTYHHAPTTIYGITKVHMELLGEYYFRRYNVDFRSVRYPGIISADTPPGGGTTDYAVDIFHHALKEGKYKCFLSEKTRLPMMYLPDCLNGTVQFLNAPREALTQCTYNMSAISFTPEEITKAIQKKLPHLSVTYQPDFRQAIADSWPGSLDDSLARKDWGWKPAYDLNGMVGDMLNRLAPQYRK